MGQANGKPVSNPSSATPSPLPHPSFSDRSWQDRPSEELTQRFISPSPHADSPMSYSVKGNSPLPSTPLSANTLRPRTLARKLSRKVPIRRMTDTSGHQRSPSTAQSLGKAARTLGEDMKSFEEMIMAEESRAGDDVSRDDDRPFASYLPTKTNELGNLESSMEPAPGPHSAPVISRGPACPLAASKNGHHRRTSSNSVYSSKTSIKSTGSRRAEKEWRAKVAALALKSGSPRTSTIVEVRGPVPPKRSMLRPQTANPCSSFNTPPLNTDPSDLLSSSPNSEKLVTPPHTEVDGSVCGQLGQPTYVCLNDVEGKRARSFVSSRSFDTLGHHPFSSIPIGLDSRSGTIDEDDLEEISEARTRKASVPLSVSSYSRSVSSFYFDPNGSRVSSRPTSIATANLLSTASTASVIDDDGESSALRTPTAPAFVAKAMRGRRETVLPLAIDIPSAGKLANSVSPRRHLSMSASALEHSSSARFDQFDPLPLRERKDTSQSDPLPMRYTAESTQSNRPSIVRSYTTTSSFSANVLESPMTPRSPYNGCTGSSTPHSPTTNYLLTAPIESIPWSIQPGLETPEKATKAHPYARTMSLLVEPTRPAPPPPPAKSPVRLDPGLQAAQDERGWIAKPLRTDSLPESLPQQPPALDIFLGTLGHVPQPLFPAEGRSSKARPNTSAMSLKREAMGSVLKNRRHIRSKTQLQIPASRETTHAFSSVLKKTKVVEISRPIIPAKTMAVGRDDASKQQRQKEWKVGLKGVDLTPGMDSGHRPPNTGFRMAVSRSSSKCGEMANFGRSSKGGFKPLPSPLRPVVALDIYCCLDAAVYRIITCLTLDTSSVSCHTCILYIVPGGLMPTPMAGVWQTFQRDQPGQWTKLVSKISATLLTVTSFSHYPAWGFCTMANPRQRSKARSHKSTKPSHAAKRRMHHRLRKPPPLKGPEVLQQGWDSHKTVFQK